MINDNDNHIALSGAEEWTPPDRAVMLDENNGWHRSGTLLDGFYSMYQPEVIYVPEREGNYPYLMWFFAWAYTQENDPCGDYCGYPGGDAIFHARAQSLDGPWEVYSVKDGVYFWDSRREPRYWYPVLVCDDKWYDSWHVGDPSIVYMDGVFYMAYSSMGCDEDGIPYHKPGDTDGNASCIMGATSRDGIHWERTEAPIIVWEHEKGFNERENKSGYMGGHQRPSLMYEDGKWKLWYDYRESWIGYAECEGDFRCPGDWHELRCGNDPLLHSVDFDVIRIGDIYYAWGDPYVSWAGIKDERIPFHADDPGRWSCRQIVEYQSRDGINWYPSGYFLPDEGYDAIQIPQAFIDRKRGRICVFYATQRGKREGETYDWRWDSLRYRWRALEDFRRPYKDCDSKNKPIDGEVEKAI